MATGRSTNKKCSLRSPSTTFFGCHNEQEQHGVLEVQPAVDSSLPVCGAEAPAQHVLLQRAATALRAPPGALQRAALALFLVGLRARAAAQAQHSPKLSSSKLSPLPIPRIPTSISGMPMVRMAVLMGSSTNSALAGRCRV
jgi:hypothetical protein